MLKRICLISAIFLVSVPVPAQLVQENREAFLPDSFYYHQAGDLYRTHLHVIDSLTALYHQYDPARKRPIDLHHLGNLGSAARSILFRPRLQTGFDFGMHQYDAYKHHPGDFKFFDSEDALTDLDYSQGPAQESSILRAKFRRAFTKGVKFSIDYQRINQIGEFAYQRAKHTGLGVGVLYDAPSGKYTGMFLYQSNSIVQEDNGGITNYELLDSANLPLMEPDLVHLHAARTVNREKYLGMEHHFHIFRENDSTSSQAQLDFIAGSNYKVEYYRFSDTDPDPDGGYYGGFFTDERGLRNFIYARTFQNSAHLQFRGLQTSMAAADGLRIRGGVTHKSISYDQEPVEDKLQEFYIDGEIAFRLKEAFDIRSSGSLGLFDARNNYLLRGGISYAHPVLGVFSAEAYIFQRQPWLVERRVFVTQQPVWNQSFDNPNYQGISFQWRVPRWKFDVGAEFQLLGNHIVFNEDRLPVQIGDSEPLVVLQAHKTFEWGHFGLVNRAFLQQYDNDLLALPEWMYKGQVYYTGRWFQKNLQVRFGVDYRVHSNFPGVGYFPLTGQFFTNGGDDMETYHQLDAFLSMRVKRFRAYVKFENFSALWDDAVYSQVAGYPQFEGYFRFGLNMRLYN